MSGGDRRLGLVYWRIDVTKSSKSYRARLCDRPLVIGCVAFALMAVSPAFSQVPIAESTGPASKTFPEQQPLPKGAQNIRSAEHTSELQSLMRNSYSVFCLKKKKKNKNNKPNTHKKRH